MENLRGVVKVKPTNKKDFVFEALEFIAEDVAQEEEDDSEEEVQQYKPPVDGIYTVVIYGLTAKSESVSLKIQEFQPYFYVRVPYDVQGKFTGRLLKRLIFELKEKVFAKYKNSIVASEIVMRKEFYGFTKEKPIQFIRLRFQSLGASRAYARLFQERIKVTSIHKNELLYQLYESNIDPIIRLCHIQDIKPKGWIKLPAGTFTVVNKFAKETTAQYEFQALWNTFGPADNPDIAPMIIASTDIECASNDGSFPKADKDPVIQIGTTCHYHGQNDCFLKHMITLGDCDPIEGVIVESYNTEAELFIAWSKFIQKLDPDIVTGYNIWGFDMKYMYDRAVILGVEDEFCQLGRRRNKKSVLIEKTLQSSALGQNLFYILEMEGRVQVDIMKVVQRDYKLDMYKLDFVAEHFLKSNKVDLSPQELFAKFKQGGSKNIHDIAVYCIQDCELCNRLMNKLEIITNNVGMANVCYVPFYWLFLRGQGVKIYSLVSRQARLEGFLLKLQKKGRYEDKGYEGAVVLVATPGIYMTPISVLDYASLYPSSMISENISHDSIVFFKVIDNYGNIVNLQFDKPGWYSMPEFREADNKKKLDEYCKKLGYKTNYIESINYEGYYGNLTDMAGDESYECKRTAGGKKIVGKTICCFVEKEATGEKSVIPRILHTLLWERRRTRASAFYKVFKLKNGEVIEGDFVKKPDDDPEYYHIAEYKQPVIKLLKKNVKDYNDKFTSFQQAVLDGLQLAYKITANSLYGQIGAPTSPIYFKELAAATTATGREMLRIAKDASEEKYPGCKAVYGDSVPEDTPLLLRRKNGKIVIKTIGSLAEEWDAYDGFRAGESNRREKQQAMCDLEIWVKDKWATIHRVIRHKTKKRIYRVNSHQGCVDVTEDHSLIDDCGNLIKATECVMGETKLMHGFPTEFSEYNVVLDDKPKNLGLSLRNGEINFVPEEILNASIEMRREFLEGYSDNSLECFEAKGKLVAQSLFYIAKSIGYNNLAIIYSEKDTYWIKSCNNQNEDVKSIIDLGYCSEETFVYDIETSEQRFNAGIGCLTIKNTDSVFLDFSDYWQQSKGINVREMPDAEAVQLAIDTGLECGKYVTSLLKKPQDLEYEKVFYPFVQVSKKRYMAMKFETDPTKGKINVNGVALKRRDFCQMVKTIFGGVMDKIIYDRSVKEAEKFFVKSVKELLEGKADLKQLIITKTLRATYANPQSIAHAALAEKMRARNDPNKPQANDRVPYVFIQTKVKKGVKLLQGDKVEHPSYIRDHPEVKPDYMYYLEHQIKNPCLQVFALALDQLEGYRPNWMDDSVINKMRAKGKLEKDIEDKLGDLREAEAERLLIGDIIRRYNNSLTGTRMITEFFTKRKEDDITQDLMAMKPRKKLEPKGITAIKADSEKRKEEDVNEKIVDVDSSVKKRLTKIKQTRKVVKKQTLTKEEEKIKKKLAREEKVKLALGK
jgi:DNA polymerase elongation subunit (family B)